MQKGTGSLTRTQAHIHTHTRHTGYSDGHTWLSRLAISIVSVDSSRVIRSRRSPHALRGPLSDVAEGICSLGAT